MRSNSASSAAQAAPGMPQARATAMKSVPAAAAGVGWPPVIWYAPLSKTTTARFRDARAATGESEPSCISREPSPSRANTLRAGCASATPRAIGTANPMLPSM